MDLKTLCELNGTSGDEGAVRRAILDAARPLCDSVRIDRMGNVIAFKKGRTGSHRILFSANMDEIGFIILDATEDGLLQFRPIGNIDPRDAVSKYVLVGEKRVPGVIGALAIHLQSDEQYDRVLDYESLYIDIGAKSRDDALEDCPKGCYAYYDSGYEEFGEGFVVSKALDSRAGCCTMLRMMEKQYDADVTYAFVTQKEVGMRGALGAAFDAQADDVIVLGCTAAADIRGTDKGLKIYEAGMGVAVSFMDRTSIADAELYRTLMDLAEEKRILHQARRDTAGISDSGSYQLSREGMRTCVLSVPCRYIHGPSEVVKLSDVEAQYELADAFAGSQQLPH
ncbi:MAG: M42 family peptidase [Clostridia bacterium]|nr:M42 family peptidase [Clostridia bacterium]